MTVEVVPAIRERDGDSLSFHFDHKARENDLALIPYLAA